MDLTKRVNLQFAKIICSPNFGGVQFNSSDITITKDAVRNIIQHCTDNEKGVRNLKRCRDSSLKN